MEHYKGLQSSFSSILFICFFSFGSESVGMEFTQLSQSLLFPHRELLTVCECPMVFTPPGFYSPYISGMPFTWAIFLFILPDQTQILSFMHSYLKCLLRSHIYQAHFST